MRKKWTGGYGSNQIVKVIKVVQELKAKTGKKHVKVDSNKLRLQVGSQRKKWSSYSIDPSDYETLMNAGHDRI